MENKTENKKLLYNKKGRLTIGFSGIADFRSIIGQEIFAGVVKACEDFDVNLINFVGAVKYKPLIMNTLYILTINSNKIILTDFNGKNIINSKYD